MQSISPEISQRRIFRGSVIVAAGLFGSQLSGFVRQAAIGYLLGTGSEADALTTAMAPVELWWSVLALTVIYGFVPSFAKAEHRFADILKPVLLVALLSGVVIFVFAELLVGLFAPGLDEATVARGVTLTRLLAPAPLAIGCGFVYSAFLMSHRRFALASLHHAIVNVATIAGAFALGSVYGGIGFCTGYVAGTYVYWLSGYLAVRELLRSQSATSRAMRPGDLLRGPGPILGQALAMELNTVVTRAYASTYGTGMTAAFDFGFKLFRVPMALLVIPISQSLLPEISSMSAEPGLRGKAVTAIKRAIVVTAAITFVGSIVMVLVREPLVSLLFERGQFGRASTAAVGLILLSYAPSMMGRAVLDLSSRTLFGLSQYRGPLIAAVLALAINLAICGWAGPAGPEWIGVGAIVGFLIGALWLVQDFLRRERNVV